MASSEASLSQDHQKVLEILCRLCGKRTQTHRQEVSGKKPKKIETYALKIRETFGVDVTQDSDDLHPKYLCSQCYFKLFNKTKHLPYEWTHHPSSSESECKVCSLSRQLTKGGRPRKPLVGRGAKSSKQITPDLHFLTLLADSNILSPVRVDGFTSICPIYTCPICKRLLKEPVETPCNHVFCLQCIHGLFREVSPHVQCPKCQQEVHVTNIKRVTEYFQQALTFACMECNKCKAKVSIDQRETHKCISSPQYKFSLFKSSPTDPLTPRTERLGTVILKRKLAHASDGISVYFKTDGQKMVTVCVPQARVTSENASKSAKRRRTHALKEARHIMSGGAVEAQLTDEVKLHQSQSSAHQNLLQKMSLQQIHIPDGSVLSMKAELGISEGEKSLRKQGQLIIGDNLLSEKLPFLFNDNVNGGKVVKSAACVSTKSLQDKIIDQHRAGKLTWHDGVIPDDTIWIKIGGDKGGHSFKQMFQVANVEKPNALSNTVVVCAFEADDSIYNLELGLKRHQEQLAELMKKIEKPLILGLCTTTQLSQVVAMLQA